MVNIAFQAFLTVRKFVVPSPGAKVFEGWREDCCDHQFSNNSIRLAPLAYHAEYSRRQSPLAVRDFERLLLGR